jgi:stage II sporulation protein D
MLWAFMVFMLLGSGCRKKHFEPTPGTESPENTWVRVLLFGNLRECTIASESGFLLEDLSTGTVANFEYSRDVAVRCDGERIAVGEHCFGSDLLLQPNEPFVFSLDGANYRGHLRLIIEDGAMQVVNSVPLESYLYGVVGAEMQSYWEPEALMAQSVCCRTYCLSIKRRFGQNRNWDVRRSESHQVYLGLQAETAAVRQAVSKTSGQLLVCGNGYGGSVLFPTYYSSSCGGHTESSRNVFGGQAYEPLSGVECLWCRTIARQKDFYWPPVTLSMKQISNKLTARYPSLEKLEGIADFEIDRLGRKSRITRVRLIGTNGKKDSVRGEDFRLCLDSTGRKIKSAIFSAEKKDGFVTFQNGLGFGHGVGLCQCGAQGMARQGRDYKQILEHYFPGSELVTIGTSDEALLRCKK